MRQFVIFVLTINIWQQNNLVNVWIKGFLNNLENKTDSVFNLEVSLCNISTQNIMMMHSIKFSSDV